MVVFVGSGNTSVNQLGQGVVNGTDVRGGQTTASDAATRPRGVVRASQAVQHTLQPQDGSKEQALRQRHARASKYGTDALCCVWQRQS